MAWTAATLVARSSSKLLDTLSALPKNSTHNVLLFALSANTPDLDSVVKHVSSLAPRSIGCLSSPFLPPLAKATGLSPLFSLSVALGNAANVVPFRSVLHGRAVAQVGRWHAFAKPNAEDEEPPSWLLDQPSSEVDWAQVWNDKTHGREVRLPPELEHIMDPGSVNAIIYFSDNAPEGLEKALLSFPSATKIGVFGASTPFLNGRPYTLFQDSATFSTGAVGVALCNPPSLRSTLTISLPSLHPLSPPMTVTDADGNLVHELDGRNPSKILLDAIHVNGGSRNDEEYLLGVLNGDKNPEEVYKIISGDPSRGTMSLDCMVAPPPGTIVRLYRGDPSQSRAELGHHLRHTNSDKPSFRFVATLPESDLRPGVNTPAIAQNEVRAYKDVFMVGTENGFTAQRHTDERTLKCIIPGTVAAVDWSNGALCNGV